MNSDQNQRASRDPQTESLSPSVRSKHAYDDIALRAYFIALDRHRRGEESDPLKDWVEAEHQLSLEA
jgi:hypothetical protein